MKAVRSLWIAAGLAALMIAFGCGSSTPPESAEKAPQAAAEQTAPPAEVPATEAPAEQPPPDEVAKLEPPVVKEPTPKAPAPKAPAGNPVVVMETSKGTIRIELNAAKAPNTVKNFLAYVDSGFYNGTIFHRVIPNFMIQGGGFTAGMAEKDTRPPIQNESANGLTNDRGTIAMARTGDPHSATAQFFINHGGNNAFLNKDQSRDGWGYAVFGKVIEGMDVVDAIAAVPTGVSGGMENVPATPVVIKSVRRAS
jgi:cyclophilin family peptidyl-prolyl cis-trans isomerase